ncbi:MAG: YraN family protein [Acidobacteriota bacterium]
MDPRHRRGQLAETVAARWLRAHGYRLLARNVRYRGGELDIVACLGALVVFVEVRARRAGSRIDPLESISQRKRKRVIASAQRWLQEHSPAPRDCRFDVIAVRESRGGRLSIEHVAGAFLDEG